MSKKEEKAREYTENILSPYYPMVDSYFNSYELEDAFEAGWDAAINKACEYLKREYEDIGIRYVRGCNVEEEIEELKKFVEE